MRRISKQSGKADRYDIKAALEKGSEFRMPANTSGLNLDAISSCCQSGFNL